MTWPSKNPDDYMSGAGRQEPSPRAQRASGILSSIGIMCSVFVLVGDGTGVVLRALAVIGAGLAVFAVTEFDVRRKRGRSKTPRRP